MVEVKLSRWGYVLVILGHDQKSCRFAKLVPGSIRRAVNFYNTVLFVHHKTAFLRMHQSAEVFLIDSFTAWWQSILQSILSLFSSNSVTFEPSGRVIYFSEEDDAAVGEGAYSVVLKASAAYGGSAQYALKRMFIQSAEVETMVQNEIGAFHKFKHKNIINLIDSTIITERSRRVAYLLFPLMQQGSLRTVLTTIGKPKDKMLPNILKDFRKVCVAVNVLHTYKPSHVHLDIKLENVLVDAQGEPYLIDLGSARPAEVRIDSRKDALRIAEEAAQHCTASYRAPELYDPPRGVVLDARTDVWSLGCLLFAWWFGYSPFECEFAGNVVKVVECSALRVLAGIPRPAAPSAADAVVLELVDWILVKDWAQRPYTSDVIERVQSVLQGLSAGENSV